MNVLIVAVALLFLSLVFVIAKSGKGVKAMVGSLLIIVAAVAAIELGISLIAMGISTEAGRASLVALGAVILVVTLIYFIFDIAISIIYFMLDEKERKTFGRLLALRSWKVKEE